MERLNQDIKEAITKGSWRLVRCCRNAPWLSYLFFVHDIVLFSKASI